MLRPAEVILTFTMRPMSSSPPGKLTISARGDLPPTQPASRAETLSTSTSAVVPTMPERISDVIACCFAMSVWMRRDFSSAGVSSGMEAALVPTRGE